MGDDVSVLEIWPRHLTFSIPTVQNAKYATKLALRIGDVLHEVELDLRPESKFTNYRSLKICDRQLVLLFPFPFQIHHLAGDKKDFLNRDTGIFRCVH